MSIDFYFDPTCPFSWITSRWLLLVYSHREININWKPFSLALKNEVAKKSDPSEHDLQALDSLRFLRVSLAAFKNHGVSLLDLYSASGMIKHILQAPLNDDSIKQILEELKLPSKLINEADNEHWDIQLNDSIKSATEVVGKDVGVPIIIFENKESKQGYFGPVLNELPNLPESLDIWDGLSKLATSKSFFELKRTRPEGNPDTGSTARC